MILPDINFDVVDLSAQPSLTYQIDFDRKRISGTVDGNEAMKQAVFIALETERYSHVIYSLNFGSELHGLIGRDEEIFQSEAKRMITEALMFDGRVNDITDFIFTGTGRSKKIDFTVYTVYGITQGGITVDV